MAAAGVQGGGRLGEAALPGAVVGQQGADGGEGGVGHVLVGGGEEPLHLGHHLVQLPGGEPEGKLAQVLRDILGDLALAGFQGLGELHRDLVAAVPAEGGSHGQEGFPRHAADHHVLADLDEVGEVGGDVEEVLALRPLRLIEKILHADGLQHPMGGGLQVVQKDAADGLGIVQQALQALRGEAQLPAEPQGGEAQGGAAAPEVRRGLGDAAPDRGIGGKDGQQVVKEPGGGGLLRLRAVPEPVGGKACQHGGVRLRAAAGGKAHHGVQQGEGGLGVQVGGMAAAAKEFPHEAGGGGVRAVGQQGLGHQLCRVADGAGLLGGQAAVRLDELCDQLRPKEIGPVLPGVRGGVLGVLLAVAGAEICQDPAHQHRRLATDVAVRIDQELIEKVQGLLLLVVREVGEILLKGGDVGPDLGPVLLAAGGFQHAGEEMVVAEAVHQADVVVHRRPPQAHHHLVRGEEGGILPLWRGKAQVAQGGVHPEGDEVLLKIPELGVDEAVAQALGLVHVVQLREDHVEGVLQGEDLRDLAAVLIPGLLHPEVRVHQDQRLRREVLDLQVPDGVVGRDVAHGGEALPGEPLVRVVIVEVGHPLPGPAAELADVVARGGGAHEGEIHEPPALGEGPGRPHGHVVDPRNVLQRPVRGDLLPQAQQLVDVLPLPAGEEAAVFLRQEAAGKLLLRAEGKVQPGVEGQAALLPQQDLQDLQQAEAALPDGQGLRLRPLGVEDAHGAAVGGGEPALLRLRGEGVQQGAAEVPDLAAGEAAGGGEPGLQLPGPVHGLQQGQGPLPGKLRPGQEFRRGEGAGQGPQGPGSGSFRHSVSSLTGDRPRMVFPSLPMIAHLPPGGKPPAGKMGKNPAEGAGKVPKALATASGRWYTGYGKQKCGSLQVRQHPQACAGGIAPTQRP